MGDESLEESSDGDGDKKRQGKKNRQPQDKKAIILELLSLQKPSLLEFGGDPTCMQYQNVQK